MRTMWTAGLLALTLAAPAQAADHELSFEVGTLGMTDPGYDLFSAVDGMPSLGLRAGFAFHDRLAVIASWGHSARGRTIFVDETSSEFSSAFYAESVTLGLRGDIEVLSWLLPYATLQGMAVIAEARLDEDPDDKDNLNQLSATGVAPGGVLAGGLELRLPPGLVRTAPTLTLGLTFEAGYALLAPMQLGDMGDLRAGGLFIRSGIGVRL